MDKRLLALVDEEQRMRKRQLRNLLILALAVSFGLGGLLYALNEVAKANRPAQVQIDPARLPPIRPGPN